MIEPGESELFLSILGRFATGSDTDLTARQALESAELLLPAGVVGRAAVRVGSAGAGAQGPQELPCMGSLRSAAAGAGRGRSTTAGLL
ncbi:hypothetical protein ACH41H_46050 [Streptomyces sp. NPDC020800]|uniref:hypothetical protein n=1 Tax=Streptomyces sp. NPDC020800 TaxID=3365092 RepID=UPI00378F3182